MHFSLFMLFLLLLHKCFDVYIESALRNWDYTVSTFLGKPPVLFDVILFKLMQCATSCPISVRYILNIIPHLIVFRSFSHQTAVNNLVEKHEGHVSFWRLGVGGRAILACILRKWDTQLRTALMWIKIWSIGIDWFVKGGYLRRPFALQNSVKCVTTNMSDVMCATFPAISILSTFAKLQKATITSCLCMENSAASGRIFIKFYLSVFRKSAQKDRT